MTHSITHCYNHTGLIWFCGDDYLPVCLLSPGVPERVVSLESLAVAGPSHLSAMDAVSHWCSRGPVAGNLSYCIPGVSGTRCQESITAYRDTLGPVAGNLSHCIPVLSVTRQMPGIYHTAYRDTLPGSVARNLSYCIPVLYVTRQMPGIYHTALLASLRLAAENPSDLFGTSY